MAPNGAEWRALVNGSSMSKCEPLWACSTSPASESTLTSGSLLAHGLAGPLSRFGSFGGASRRRSISASSGEIPRSGTKRTTGSASNETKERMKGWPHAMHLSPFWLSNGLIVWQRKHRGREGER